MKSATRLMVTLVMSTGAWAATTCAPTGFFQDNVNMTAAKIDPVGAVSGEVDATSCNIGVYYSHGKGQVSKANIHGSNYFGVVVNGDSTSVAVDVLNSTIHDIGESPLNGSQHGVAIYYRGFGPGNATGKINGNTIERYQKGGIIVNGTGAKANVSDNIVNGAGAIKYIAQNGIQIGYGASAQVMRNMVMGNAYNGLNCAASGGIIAFGGPAYDGPYTTGT